jgi:molybdopterin-containing oxidoreductase family iron-sulfur binding subunit
VHLGQHVDETGQIAHWHLPASHYLEHWSDVRAYDGTVSIVQPLIDPLYGGHSAHDVVQLLLDEPMLSAYEAVRTTWRPEIKGDFEAGWRKALHAGWIEGTAYDKSAKASAVAAFKGSVPAPAAKDAIEIIFRPDPTVYDGRWANVGWLQELPKPVTNLSWDNAAIVSGATLTKLGLEEDDIVELTVGNGKVKAPVIVAPGHPDNSVTVYLGYGRQVGRVAGGAGFNAYLIRNTWAPHYAIGSVRKIDGSGAWRLPRATTRIIAARHLDSRRDTATTRSKPMRHWGRAALSATPRWKSSRRIPTLRTRAKGAIRQSAIRRCSRTGATTNPMHGACR